MSIAGLALGLAATLAVPDRAAAAEGAGPATGASRLFAPPTQLTYDKEYPAIGYSGEARDNPVARLQTALDRGDVTLTFHPVRGYLDAVLAALDIDTSSQVLVFSRTSLQVGGIRADSPRALYFNDDTYVAWVPDVDMLEIGTMDTRLGPVFYTLPNRTAAPARFDRPLVTCMSCHDSLTMTGGGVPRFILGSGYVGINGEQLTHEGRILTTDRTPLRSRWGGWYVTGRHGDQVHLGNMHVRSASELTNLDSLRRGNIDSLDGLFDTRRYLTNKSDIVALLVLQHQIHMQNLLTRVNFEVRSALARQGIIGTAADTALVELPASVRDELDIDIDTLANAMLFVGAVSFTSPIEGGAGFDSWFEARGPRDGKGRSLRQLDLKTRLFAYPLSFTLYSAAFDALPAYAKRRIYGRFAGVLGGQDTHPGYDHLSPTDRAAISEILRATKPEFASAKPEDAPERR